MTSEAYAGLVAGTSGDNGTRHATQSIETQAVLMAMCGPTTNHDEIRRWAKAQSAIPCEIFPYVHDSEPAVLRFMFDAVPENQTEIKPITWDQFFALFDVMGLSLVYDDDLSARAGRRHELLQIEERSAYRFEGKPL